MAVLNIEPKWSIDLNLSAGSGPFGTGDDFSLRFFSKPHDHSDLKLLKNVVLPSDFPIDQKLPSIN